MKQWNAKIFSNDKSIRFFIGDVRDKDRLYRALHGVDFVVCCCNKNSSNC